MSRNRRCWAIVALALLAGACSDADDESVPTTTAVTTTTLSTAPVPIDDLHIASEYRVALVGGDGGVLLVDGSSGDGRSIAAWRIDRDDPTTAVPVALPVDGRYGRVSAAGFGDAFVVVAQRCPSDLWDDPAARDLDAPESTMDPCGSTAHDVLLVPSDGSEATLIAEGLEPERDPEGSLIPVAATSSRAYLHWTDGTDGFVVATDGELVPVAPDPGLSHFCEAGDEIYAIGRAPGVQGNPGQVPRPASDFVRLVRLRDGAWVPVSVPPGPLAPYAGLSGCAGGRFTFNTSDEATDGALILDVRSGTPTWTRLPIPDVPMGTTSVRARAGGSTIALEVSGPGPSSSYTWDDDASVWRPGQSAGSARAVEGGTLELVPHPSSEGRALQLVPGS